MPTPTQCFPMVLYLPHDSKYLTNRPLTLSFWLHSEFNFFPHFILLFLNYYVMIFSLQLFASVIIFILLLSLLRLMQRKSHHCLQFLLHPLSLCRSLIPRPSVLFGELIVSPLIFLKWELSLSLFILPHPLATQRNSSNNSTLLTW